MSTLEPTTGRRPDPAEMIAHLGPEQLREQVEQFGKYDPEVAHGLVDDLMREALKAIRDGHPDPAKLAADVLTVDEADFPRWCA